MLICIDSCVFIRGLKDPLSDANRLLNLLSPALPTVIPRLVAIEVTHNLQSATDQARFYRLFYERPFAMIIDEDLPNDLLTSYIAKGLRAKGDAYIGAFAEWMQVDYLISDNRHFLRELQTDAYQLMSPGDFLNLLSDTENS
jgi:hypothetical protein